MKKAIKILFIILLAINILVLTYLLFQDWATLVGYITGKEQVVNMDFGQKQLWLTEPYTINYLAQVVGIIFDTANIIISVCLIKHLTKKRGGGD